MSETPRSSGPQFRADNQGEQEAVRTTIVGGRPPGSGQPLGDIPRGVEVLVKKASVDPAFRKTLVSQRAAAAGAIGLVLEPAEKLMLQAVPAEQLEAIIDRTRVPNSQRRVFLGAAASAMLAALSAGVAGCDTDKGIRGVRPQDPGGTRGSAPDFPNEPAPTGIAPDLPPEPGPSEPSGSGDAAEDGVGPGVEEGDVMTFGIQPEMPPRVTGKAPDLPPEPPTSAPPGASPD